MPTDRASVMRTGAITSSFADSSALRVQSPGYCGQRESMFIVTGPSLTRCTVFVYFLGDAFIKDDTLTMPKSIYYFSGLLFWNFFSQGVSASANSMVSNANIIKKIYFPRLIISISAVLTAAFDFLMTTIVFISLVIYTDMQTDSFYVNWPDLLWSLTVGSVITFAFTVSVGTLLAAINVKYRDVDMPSLLRSRPCFFYLPSFIHQQKFQTQRSDFCTHRSLSIML